MARVTWVMRATSLIALPITAFAQKVDLNTVRAVTGDGCGQIFSPDLMVDLKRWVRVGEIAPVAVVLVAFVGPYRSLSRIPALAVWTVVALEFLITFSESHRGI